MWTSSLIVGLMASLSMSAQLTQVQYQTQAQNKPQMWIYVPDNVVENPPGVVVLHSCQSSAQAYFSNRLIPWKQGSDRKGYVTIWPSAQHGNCWDASSRRSLVRDGGGDSQAISDMMRHAVANYHVDPKRIYVTGGSSGAMMSNIMAATYPDMIQAVSLYSGVPAGCFMSVSGGVDQWNNTCSGGQSRATPEKWGDVARAMYPGYNGTRPKMQIWHGSVDTTLNSNNYMETIKQWTNVWGYDQEPDEVIQNYPQMNYQTQIYGPGVHGIWAVGVGHSVPANLTASEEWFGL